MIYLLIALNVALLVLVIAALVKLRRIDGITQVFARQIPDVIDDLTRRGRN
jgi:hypothetical protein